MVVGVAHLHITLALVELVHVGVAEVATVLLDAGHKLLLEAEAHILLLVLSSGLLGSSRIVWLLLLHGLLLRGRLVVATVATTATHH